MLKKAEARQGVLFTINYGAIPVWSVHLACDSMYLHLFQYMYHRFIVNQCVQIVM